MELKKWECIVCGLIYDEAEGWPDDGIEPGTKWDYSDAGVALLSMLFFNIANKNIHW